MVGSCEVNHAIFPSLDNIIDWSLLRLLSLSSADLSLQFSISASLVTRACDSLIALIVGIYISSLLSGDDHHLACCHLSRPVRMRAPYSFYLHQTLVKTSPEVNESENGNFNQMFHRVGISVAL